ncbi:hypothetical protein PHYBOEH_007682 [Phytophthora boehmeriae]|uniref:Necrosis inducing-like protein NPP1 type n=1 Tax=Phytophthora boehmeriae TaxID=109152 RepID=A0A8T1W9G2_9STRA|nr:hypothetical protein PHYBOEH_007682 [Phytophthora boehmeriae]
MKLRALAILAVVAALTTAGAVTIDHDKVQPFAQPKPAIDFEKAAIAFKPYLHISSGCHPYPAVNADGDTSGGLKGTRPADGECLGSVLGSQVYARATWYNDLWAIMYAWYFPKDVPLGFSGLFRKGRRHAWANIVVWINNPTVERPTIIGVSTPSIVDGYIPHTPPSPGLLDITGYHCKINYVSDGSYHSVDTTGDKGDFQDLIMWEQLTEEARTALQETDFGETAEVPFIDANFEANLEKAWPYV